MVQWRCKVPFSKAGIDYVLELARLYQAYADNSTLHLLHLLLGMCFRYCYFRSLIHARTMSKDHVHCLEHCLDLWHHGDITALVKEG